MASKKRGLGRGLGALIPPAPDLSPRPPAQDHQGPDPTTPSPVDSPNGQRSDDDADQLAPVPARYRELPIADIEPNARQPRQIFEEEALAELVHSIREIGLLQPIVVRPAGDRWELVAGERRWRASQQAGLSTIPAIIRDTSDDQMLRDALLENLHRAALNPLEEAAAYQQLLDDFECTQEELAARIGRSRPQVSNTIRLLRLPTPVARRVAAGVLSAGHARAILALDDESAMEELAARIVAEGLSVRATEEIVAVGGGSRRTPRKGRAARTTSPELNDLADRIAERLETRVSISGRKLVIEFGSPDDLRRIVDSIDSGS